MLQNIFLETFFRSILNYTLRMPISVPKPNFRRCYPH